ncbi:Hypothetical protein BQ3484_20 [Cedratvirus A11]|uniref:Uncharacterized protein n=1 Tax=Cedratvirus A11 TaxID=1903266 RepID=A0A1M7XUA3_9VIRU|nr:Hypothetical protein BQ3484_20 [Cedratvirus A11]SHO33088.1 Hypothetical protein BQ3484_20 [Cedratvirus A11]
MQFLTNLFNTERSEFSLDGILNRSEGEDRFYDFVDRLFFGQPRGFSLDGILNRSEGEDRFYDFVDRFFFGQPLNLDHFLNEIRDNGFVLTDRENSLYSFLHDD